MHYLICDDDPVIRYLLDMVLAKRGGHRVTAVADPTAVQALASGDRPDAVLVDYTMPGMSGIEVARALGADPKLAGIPVVLLTGRADLDSHDYAGTAICGLIEKPFDTSTLISHIEDLIGASSAA